MFKEHQLRDDHFPEVNHKRPLRKKCGMYVRMLLRNFLDGKIFSIRCINCSCSSNVRTNFNTSAIGQGPFSSPAVMMGLALHFITLFRSRCIYCFVIPKYIFNSITRSSYMDRWLKICL